MNRSEYIMIQISIITQEFLDKYNLKDKALNGYIFTWVNKGIYGILQEGRIAHDTLVQHLGPYIYHPSNKNLGLWTHDSHPINFTLVVDDFGVRHSRRGYALHLKAALEDK